MGKTPKDKVKLPNLSLRVQEPFTTERSLGEDSIFWSKYKRTISRQMRTTDGMSVNDGGLNITGANYVIIFDPNWNPSHDLQAADRYILFLLIFINFIILNLRAYRIGQQRDVFVYRLISSGCIEENIYLRQVDKQLLNKECVENEDSRRYFSGSKKSKNESEIYGMENLLHLATDNACLT